MTIQWYRTWHGMPFDPKWRTIARVSGQPISAVIAVFMVLLDSASSNEAERGVFSITAEDIASALDLQEDSVNAILAAMRGKVLDENRLTGWAVRQPLKEDTGDPKTGAKSARERQQLKRARDKGDVTASHDMSRNVTTDKDKDKDKETDSSSSLRSDDDAVASPHEDTDEQEDNSPTIVQSILEVGIPSMIVGGCTEKSARSLLGKLRKELGDDLEALLVVEALATEKPLNAAEWMAAAIRQRAGAVAISFAEFKEGCRERSERMISEYQPVLDYVGASNLPTEFMTLAWAEFRRRHEPGGAWENTRRKDWRRAFRVALETNAMRLWYIDVNGQYTLTTAGQQAARASEAN